jgi:hypothetical protein
VATHLGRDQTMLYIDDDTTNSEHSGNQKCHNPFRDTREVFCMVVSVLCEIITSRFILPILLNKQIFENQ